MGCHTSLLKYFVVLLGLYSVNGALIPDTGKHTSVHLFKRAVTYGDTGNEESKSSICNDDQKKVLERSMGEAAKLAKAGSDGLDMILDMLTPEKTKYKELSRIEKDRIRNTYFTFFGKISKPEQFPDAITRAQFIKTILDRIAGLDVATWPQEVKIFCDSTYYTDKDADGKTWDQVDGPKDAPPKPSKEWKYDWDEKIWSEVKKKASCAVAGSEVAGWTLPFNDENRDRMTFCPVWFQIIAEPKAGKSFTDLDPTQDIVVGTKLKDFTRKSGRIFLHEHLHTWTFNQIADNSIKLHDVDDPNSYGPDNARRLASDPATIAKANRNIENIVYWSISMFYPTWNWATLEAAVPVEQPKPT